MSTATRRPALGPEQRHAIRRRRESGLHDVMADFIEAYRPEYGRRPRTETREAMGALLPWLGRAYRHEGDEFLRSWPQIARGLGWPTSSAKEDHQRYRNNLANRLNMLMRLGWLESWEPVYKANGESRGILVRLSPAGVAQSVRASAFGRPPRRSRGPQNCPPATPPAGGADHAALQQKSASCTPLREKIPHSSGSSPGQCGRAPASDASKRYARAHSAFAALAAACQKGIESGSAIVRGAPWLAELPPTDLARVAIRAFAADPDTGMRNCKPVISPERRAQLETAVRQLDRFGYATLPPGPGAGAAAIIDVCAGDWRDSVLYRPGDFDKPTGQRKLSPPATLGGIAVCVRRQARRAKRAQAAAGRPS